MDGANFFQILWSIFLPLSKAGLATVALFIMVGNWNEWFTGILYMSDTKNYPLASFLQVIVVQGNQQDLALDPTTAAAMSERTIKAAQVFMAQCRSCWYIRSSRSTLQKGSSWERLRNKY